MKNIRALYLTDRLIYVVLVIVFFFLFGFVYEIMYSLGKLAFYLLLGILVVDLILLYTKKEGITASRIVPDRLSNGDDNQIIINLASKYDYQLRARVVDELPVQLQIRDQEFDMKLGSKDGKRISYTIRPVRRGDYLFGSINIFVRSAIGLLERKYRFDDGHTALVYPSFIQMRKYELLALTYKLQDEGIKKIRRIGQNKEFEQIKDYVVGDDIRTLNWKATARVNKLMVNTYQDEKSQQVYSLINKGRVMQMPFEGMTLLDYAINASLAISNIALKKDDKPGLVTFQHKVATVLPASKRKSQIRYFLDVLYREKTAFKETDYSKLYSLVKSKINKRSMLLMYTNFESLSSMRQQLPFLKKIAASHLLVCIIFENTELKELIRSEVKSLDDIYTKTIAEKLAFEKKMIARELNKIGIQTILTKPTDLTVNSINKYLEVKARGML
ncbi:MAG: DUF58 domain-containing protein [Cyclobacteriaceae bacterium]